MAGGHDRERFLRNAASTDDLPFLVLAAEEGGRCEESLAFEFESLNDLERLYSELNE